MHFQLHSSVATLHTWHNKSWAVSHLLVLIEEVIRVLVEHHAPDRLQREDVLRPGLGVIQRVKVKLVLISNLHGLDHQLPLWVVTSCNGIVQVLQPIHIDEKLCKHKDMMSWELMATPYSMQNRLMMRYTEQ